MVDQAAGSENSPMAGAGGIGVASTRCVCASCVCRIFRAARLSRRSAKNYFSSMVEPEKKATGLRQGIASCFPVLSNGWPSSRRRRREPTCRSFTKTKRFLRSTNRRVWQPTAFPPVTMPPWRILLWRAGRTLLMVGKSRWEPGLVHRLDVETSGLILVAKTQTAFASLRKQFRRREVNKTYWALVWGDSLDARRHPLAAGA